MLHYILSLHSLFVPPVFFDYGHLWCRSEKQLHYPCSVCLAFIHQHKRCIRENDTYNYCFLCLTSMLTAICLMLSTFSPSFLQPLQCIACVRSNSCEKCCLCVFKSFWYHWSGEHICNDDGNNVKEHFWFLTLECIRPP